MDGFGIDLGLIGMQPPGPAVDHMVIRNGMGPVHLVTAGTGRGPFHHLPVITGTGIIPHADGKVLQPDLLQMPGDLVDPQVVPRPWPGPPINRVDEIETEASSSQFEQMGVPLAFRPAGSRLRGVFF